MKKLIISIAIIFSSLFAVGQQSKLILSSMDFTYPNGAILHVTAKNAQISDVIKGDTLMINLPPYQGRNGVFPIFKTKNKAYYALITSKEGNVYKKYITDRFKK